MTNQHPITPPPELVQEWIKEPQYMTEDQLGKRMNLISMNEVKFREIIDKTSQYSANQELEACCELVPGLTSYLRAARRPKPPSLKEQALAAQQRMWNGTSNHDDWNLVRRALEALND